ncbi:MAG TPA: protease modulator HflC [Verrucomicrobiae bacterium]|nr:protease modulator HflC [Verrucomicrobiae bacterium]
MKSLLKSLSGPLLLLLALIAAKLCAFNVAENETAILTQFGKPTGQTITNAGLHFKLPFIQDVNRLDVRMQEWDGQAVEMPTRDKLYITVNSFGRWRISEPMAFFTRTRDTRSALSRMDDIVGSEIRNAVAENDLIEIVRTDRTRKAELDTFDTGSATNNQTGIVANQLPPIRRGRTFVEKQIIDKAAAKLKDLGIQLVDVRIMRINYDPSVSTKINDRMISEREQIATRYRSEGDGEAAKILGNRDRDLAELNSVAYKMVQQIKGEADAKATEIYAQAYNKSPEALAFYTFLQTLETYKKIATNDTTMVLSTGDELFQYFKKPPGK